MECHAQNTSAPGINQCSRDSSKIASVVTCTAHGHTGHTGTHPPTPRTHRVPQQRHEMRGTCDLRLATKRGDVRRETRDARDLWMGTQLGIVPC
eukprot:scaffold69515_cov58-Attheya_sp.AAC.5